MERVYKIKSIDFEMGIFDYADSSIKEPLSFLS